MKLTAFQLTLAENTTVHEPMLEASATISLNHLALLSARAVSLLALNLPQMTVKTLDVDFKLGSNKVTHKEFALAHIQ
jgi:hypothetical protein